MFNPLRNLLFVRIFLRSRRSSVSDTDPSLQ